MIFQINEFHRLKFWDNLFDVPGYWKNNCKYDWLERENIDCYTYQFEWGASSKLTMNKVLQVKVY